LFYQSFATVLILLAVTAPTALVFGFGGATLARAQLLPLRLVGKTYISAVRGVPDIAFFLFFVIALDQGSNGCAIKRFALIGTSLFARAMILSFAQLPSYPWALPRNMCMRFTGFSQQVLTFAIVFGAFAANVLYGAMRAVPQAQIETAQAYGMRPAQVFWRILVPQMWVYALPGLSNLWMVLIKATPLLFLLGVEDVVYWARELGGTKQAKFSDYPHGDWRMQYFLFLLVFYLAFTKLSEVVLERVMQRLTHGQGTLGAPS
jgi:polar amino acid transport system permease protein